MTLDWADWVGWTIGIIYIPIPSTVANSTHCINLTYKTGMCVDFSDIQIIQLDGTILSYWIQPDSVVSGVSCTIYYKVATANQPYVYILWDGNTASRSNGTNTFYYFDDFSTIDTAAWTVAGSVTTDGSVATLLRTGGVNATLLGKSQKSLYGGSLITRIKTKHYSTASYREYMFTRYTNSTNYVCISPSYSTTTVGHKYRNCLASAVTYNNITDWTADTWENVRCDSKSDQTEWYVNGVFDCAVSTNYITTNGVIYIAASNADTAQLDIDWVATTSTVITESEFYDYYYRAIDTSKLDECGRYISTASLSETGVGLQSIFITQVGRKIITPGASYQLNIIEMANTAAAMGSFIINKLLLDPITLIITKPTEIFPIPKLEDVFVTPEAIKEFARTFVAEAISVVPTALPSVTKFLDEVVNLSDLLKKIPTPTRTEAVTVTPSMYKKYISRKALTEAVHVTATALKRLTRTLTTAITVTPSLIFSNLKRLSESVTATCSIKSKSITHRVSEAVHATVSALKRPTHKMTSTSVGVAPTAYKRPSKLLTTAVSVVPNMYRSFLKLLIENADMITESYKVLVRIIEDEIVCVLPTAQYEPLKLFIEYISIDVIGIKEILRHFVAESITLTDIFYTGFIQHCDEVISIVCSIDHFEPLKTLTESVGIVHSKSIDLIKYIWQDIIINDIAVPTQNIFVFLTETIVITFVINKLRPMLFTAKQTVSNIRNKQTLADIKSTTMKKVSVAGAQLDSMKKSTITAVKKRTGIFKEGDEQR